MDNTDIQKFDKDELLLILVQSGYHSVEQSDSEDDDREKLNSRRFIHVYDHEWRSATAQTSRLDRYWPVTSRSRESSRRVEVRHQFQKCSPMSLARIPPRKIPIRS